MNRNYELADASRIYEGFLDHVRLRLGDVEDRRMSQIFDSERWREQHDEQLMRNGQMSPSEAEASRYSFSRNASSRLTKEIINSRKVAAKLHHVRLRYRRACGEEVEILDVDENKIERETLRELDFILREIEEKLTMMAFEM